MVLLLRVTVSLALQVMSVIKRGSMVEDSLIVLKVSTALLESPSQTLVRTFVILVTDVQLEQLISKSVNQVHTSLLRVVRLVLLVPL